MSAHRFGDCLCRAAVEWAENVPSEKRNEEGGRIIWCERHVPQALLLMSLTSRLDKRDVVAETPDVELIQEEGEGDG
jgi:hypothetical protein